MRISPKNRWVRCLLLLVLIFSSTSLIAEGINPPVSQVSSSTVMKRKGVFLFFMNPNGRPCQIQANILHQNRAEIEKRYVIKALMTTNRSDHVQFYKYGVRSLPAIILLNANGKVHLRLPPGIQNRNAILSAIQ